jgi:2-polyprenyl-6-methoxyphenol hydroxylase-like FAD-dependent oxidoreductase
MGLDVTAIQQQLSSGSITNKAARDTHTNNTLQDYTQLQTHGYCAQEVAAGQAAKARCLQAMAGVADSVLALIAATPAASLVEHGVYIRPADSMSADSFGKGRVVIIGDAAHPMRPKGQGFNQTVEDAYALGAALVNSGSSGGDIDLSSLQVSCVLLNAYAIQQLCIVVWL